MDQILALDATGQLELLKSGSVSAVDLLEASIARADESQGKINAVVLRDIAGARQVAIEVDKARSGGQRLGRLAGLPMTLKDAIDVEGLPASAAFDEPQSRNCHDAEVVTRIRREGAVIWGKTNTPVKSGDVQTFNSLYGTTNNPWDIARTCGGSSGGSAAALATGITALEIGADIGGSIRIPASYCGVYALKPTFGVVSQTGLMPPIERNADIDMAVVGPMARSARDLKLLMSILSDQETEEEFQVSELKGLRIAVCVDEPTFALDTEVKETIQTFVHELEARGAVVTNIGYPVSAEQMMFTYTSLLFSIIGADLPPIGRLFFEGLRPFAKVALALGAKPLSWAQGVYAYTARHSEWLEANEIREKLKQSMSGFFEDYDVLIIPTSPVTAFKHDHRQINMRQLSSSDGGQYSYLKLFEWIALATVCGLPAVQMPAGLSPDGLPVGMQLIGPQGSDMKMISIASAIDRDLARVIQLPEI